MITHSFQIATKSLESFKKQQNICKYCRLTKARKNNKSFNFKIPTTLVIKENKLKQTQIKSL